MRYKQSYEDHEQDKEPRYLLDDDVEMVLENAEEEAFRDEEGSEKYKEDDDAEVVEKDEEEVLGIKGAPSSEVAQAEETSKVPSDAPPVQTNAANAMATGVGAESKRYESK